MKSITNLLTEASKEHLTYDLKADIYNVLSDLAFNYEQHNKEFNKDNVEDAIEWFLSEFYEQNSDFA